MSNKKLILNIVISVLVLGILAGVLFWVMKMPEDNGGDVQLPQASDETIEVLKLDAENVSSVKIQNENETYTIVKKGEEYTIPEKSGAEFVSTSLGFSFTSFLDINATKDVTNEEIPFSKTASATITTNDNKQYVLELGGEVVGDNSMFLKYDNKIYVVPSYDVMYFTVSLDSYKNKSLGSISQSIASLSIKENGKELVSIRKALEDDYKNFQVAPSFIMTYPKYMSVSVDRLSSLFSLVEQGYSLDVIDFVEDSTNNTSKYNIGKKTLYINDGTNDYQIAFGDKDEKGNVYAVVNNKNFICTIAPNLFDIIDSYNGDVLMDKLTHIADLQNVKNITFEGKGKKYTLEQKGTDDNAIYDINGNSIEESKFKAIYREIIGITSDKIAYENIDGNPEYTVTINYKNGNTDIWQYVTLNERNYVLKHNGTAKYICLKKNPDSAMTNIENQLK